MLYLEGIDTLGALLLRMGFSVPIYSLILITTQSTSSSPGKKDHLYVFLLGFTGYYLASYLDFKGLTFIKASLERLILFIYPTMVIILSSIVFKKHITHMQKIGVAITYVGIGIVFIPEIISSESQQYNAAIQGGALVFLSALSYSTFLVGSQWLIPRFGVRRFTAIAMIWSGTMVFIHYFIATDTPLAFLEWGIKVYLIGALMGIFSTVLPSFMISHAIHQLGAAQFSILASLGPVSTIILAYIFLAERLSIIQALGSLVIISGVVTAEYIAKKATSGP